MVTDDEVRRTAIEAILTRNGVPGATIAVTDGGGLRWVQGFGVADLTSGAPARAETVYHLFSGTKLFTATAVMQLAERGLLSLDDPVARYVPGAPPLDGVTLRQLLSHHSGLKDSLRGLLATTFPGERQLTADEALAGFALRRERAPGTHVKYANVNYALLGVVISRVTGREYRDHLREAVLAPLGGALEFTLTDAMRAVAATGYIGRWDPMRLVLRLMFPEVSRRLYRQRQGGRVALAEYDLATAAIGGLVGTMPDFARFLRSQLTGGAPLLAAPSVRSMQTMVAPGAAGIVSRVGVGLGWKIGRVGEREFLNHEGGGAGFTSELRLCPRAGIGIALAMNIMQMPRTMRIAHELCEAVLSAEAVA